MKDRILYVVAGVVFAAGLALSGMTRPEKVTAFLDVTGAWDPSLLFVMGGAVCVYFVASRLTRRGAPTTPARIDARLLAGAAIFGVGWGLAGFCPGPALVSLGAGLRAAWWFVPAMIVGMLLHDRVFARRA